MLSELAFPHAVCPLMSQLFYITVSMVFKRNDRSTAAAEATVGDIDFPRLTAAILLTGWVFRLGRGDHVFLLSSSPQTQSNRSYHQGKASFGESSGATRSEVAGRATCMLADTQGLC